MSDASLRVYPMMGATGVRWYEVAYESYKFQFYNVDEDDQEVLPEYGCESEVHIVNRLNGDCYAYGELDFFDRGRIDNDYLVRLVREFLSHTYEGDVIALGKINLIPPNAVRFIGGIPE